MRRSVGATAALLIAASGAACAAPGATATPTSTPVASGVATPSMTPAAGTPTPHPAVPEGLPVMPGAATADPRTEPGSLARWTVAAIGPDVYRFYLDALPAAGFAIRGRFPGGNVAIIRFTTPEGDTLDLALVGEDDGDRTRISLRLPEGP